MKNIIVKWQKIFVKFFLDFQNWKSIVVNKAKKGIEDKMKKRK